MFEQGDNSNLGCTYTVYFFVSQKWYWTGGTIHSATVDPEDEKDVKSSLFESEPKNGAAGVQIKGLGKKYRNGKLAVRNMYLNMYEGQTTALLG